MYIVQPFDFSRDSRAGELCLRLLLLTLNGQVNSALHKDAAAPKRKRVAGGAEKGHQRHNTEDDADAWRLKGDVLVWHQKGAGGGRLK